MTCANANTSATPSGENTKLFRSLIGDGDDFLGMQLSALDIRDYILSSARVYLSVSSPRFLIGWRARGVCLARLQWDLSVGRI